MIPPQLRLPPEQFGRLAPASVADISSGIDLSKQPGTRYQVTYANDVIRISAATVRRDLIGVNRDHDIYIFSDSPELRSKLTPGSVVLFEGASFKKIQAIASRWITPDRRRRRSAAHPALQRRRYPLAYADQFSRDTQPSGRHCHAAPMSALLAALALALRL